MATKTDGDKDKVKLKKINDFIVSSVLLGEGCYGKVYWGYFADD
jgi:hypothetical protein